MHPGSGLENVIVRGGGRKREFRGEGEIRDILGENPVGKGGGGTMTDAEARKVGHQPE